jgi:hypothetical protein
MIPAGGLIRFGQYNDIDVPESYPKIVVLFLSFYLHRKQDYREQGFNALFQ